MCLVELQIADAADSSHACSTVGWHFLAAAHCTILHFLNKIWEDELLVFVSASTLAMYGGTTDVTDSPAASLYTQFYSHLLFLLHFTALYCTILHFLNKIWEDELLFFL